MKNRIQNWRFTPFSKSGRASVPKSSGVYAILRINRVMGLPMALVPIYVGQSHNLRLRMAGHLDPAKAHNENVGFLPDRASLEFWWAAVPSELLAAAEKTLIQSVKPKANKIRYRI
ncbi:MAG TPA: GIY-YIG nuclease family protein [Verrucomicrobiae bacterium]|nr:GIY-YIG nuclease family protein [Verrucomicrobiae bacterium]